MVNLIGELLKRAGISQGKASVLYVLWAISLFFTLLGVTLAGMGDRGIGYLILFLGAALFTFTCVLAILYILFKPKKPKIKPKVPIERD